MEGSKLFQIPLEYQHLGDDLSEEEEEEVEEALEDLKDDIASAFRRLKIRFRDKTNEETQFVHTLNGTLVAIERTMVSIIENNQTKDGHIKIPTVLQKFFDKDTI